MARIPFFHPLLLTVTLDDPGSMGTGNFFFFRKAEEDLWQRARTRLLIKSVVCVETPCRHCRVVNSEANRTAASSTLLFLYSPLLNSLCTYYFVPDGCGVLRQSNRDVKQVTLPYLPLHLICSYWHNQERWSDRGISVFQRLVSISYVEYIGCWKLRLTSLLGTGTTQGHCLGCVNPWEERYVMLITF